MVKIPTFDSEFKKRTGVTDAYSGFSGGEIQVASQKTNIGDSLFKSAAHIDKYQKVKQEREGRIWLSKTKSDLTIWMADEEVRIKKENPNIDGDGHTKMMIDSFTKKSDELKKTAPNKWANDNWEIAHNTLLGVTYGNATSYEATQNIKADFIKIDEAVDAAAEVAIGNPSLMEVQIKELEKIFDTFDDKKTPGIEGFGGRINAKALSQYKKEKIQKLITTTIDSIVNEGNEESITLAKKWLEDKTYSKYLDADTIVSLKKQLETRSTEQSGRFIEDTKTMIQENNSHYIETGEPKHDGVIERIIAIHGEDSTQEAQYVDNIEMYKTMFNNKKEISFMNEEQMNKKIEEADAKQKLGNEKDIKIFQHLVAEKQKFEKLLKEDPTEWAKLYRPELYKKLTSSVEVGIDGQDDAGEAIAVRSLAYKELVDEQQKWGIASWNLKIWSKDDAANFANKINQTTNAMEAKQLIEFIKQEHGEYWEIGFNQMVQGKFLDGRWVAAIQYLDDAEWETIINRSIVNKVDESKLKGTQLAEVTAIKDNISGKFFEISTALTGTNANALEFVQNWQELVTNFAVNSYLAGEKNAGDSAFNKLVDNKFHISEGYLIPKEGFITTPTGLKVINTLEKKDYDGALENFINTEISKMDLVSMKSGSVLGELDQIDYQEFDKANFKENVVWRNTADGSGLELIWSNDFGNWPVASKVGPAQGETERIFISWDDLNKYTLSVKTGDPDDPFSYTKDGKPYILF